MARLYTPGKPFKWIKMYVIKSTAWEDSVKGEGRMCMEKNTRLSNTIKGLLC